MKRKQPPVILIILITLAAFVFIFLNGKSFDLPEGDATPLREVAKELNTVKDNSADTKNTEGEDDAINLEKENNLEQVSKAAQTMREIFVTDGVKHTIPVEEIRQGCFGRDCIPSVDDPKFVSKKEADDILPKDTVGIGLIYNGEIRFYPFNMLVTREIVNDVVGGQPLAVTYCPLCGTGIVFNRKVGDKIYEFGVSGMLWQSNLLMYNREDNEEDISLWAQVLGEAVLGSLTGTKLTIIPSDIVLYEDWSKSNPNTMVLNTGRIGDPYGGDYYGVAQNFKPSFNEDTSPISPTEYVFGLQIGDEFKAYPISSLPDGITNDVFAGKNLEIVKKDDGVVRIFEEGSDTPLEIIAGFWFSWSAVHPETELYK